MPRPGGAAALLQAHGEGAGRHGPQRKGCCRGQGVGSIPLSLLKFGPYLGIACGMRGRLVSLAEPWCREPGCPGSRSQLAQLAAEQPSPARPLGQAGSLACLPAIPSLSCVVGAQMWTVRHPATLSQEKGLWCFRESLWVMQSQH